MSARRLLVALAALALLAAALVLWLNLRGEDGLDTVSPKLTPASIERGAYLARAGNCLGCHGADAAGGRGIATPFGTVFAPNLTPDEATGLGRWTEPEFWRALHNGRSKDGRLLSPAFPYTSFTQVSREDAAALYGWLRSLPAVHRPNRAHELRWPYGSQPALAVWRALYFRPGSFEPEPQRDAAWNRGAYLVRGLGHCSACHAARDALGGSIDETLLAGGLIPVQDWFAPALRGGAGFAESMKTGGSARSGSVMGPMHEVVVLSSSQLRDEDLAAMERYLSTLPPLAPAKPAAPQPALLTLGEKLYATHCADCHGDRGQGDATFPPLAGNPSVKLAAPHNTVQAILHGGFAPATAGQPRPAGMPPFDRTLDETQIAAVASYVRQAWGNGAPAVGPLEVMRLR